MFIGLTVYARCHLCLNPSFVHPHPTSLQVQLISTAKAILLVVCCDAYPSLHCILSRASNLYNSHPAHIPKLILPTFATFPPILTYKSTSTSPIQVLNPIHPPPSALPLSSISPAKPFKTVNPQSPASNPKRNLPPLSLHHPNFPRSHSKQSSIKAYCSCHRTIPQQSPQPHL